MEQKLTSRNTEDILKAQANLKRMEDEITYLKRHHEMEITMMKEQYERSIETAKLIATETRALNALHQNQQVMSSEFGRKSDYNQQNKTIT